MSLVLDGLTLRADGASQNVRLALADGRIASSGTDATRKDRLILPVSPMRMTMRARFRPPPSVPRASRSKAGFCASPR